jgi:hypothetical protein
MLDDVKEICDCEEAVNEYSYFSGEMASWDWFSLTFVGFINLAFIYFTGK